MAEEKPVRKARAVNADHIGVMLAALFMAVAGWAGIAYLVTNTLPRAMPYWLFFLFLFVAVTGTALPFVRFLNMRFRRGSAFVAAGVVLRQSIWVALFVTTCAWLQIPRLLNGVLAILLAASLAVIELFLRLRERAQAQA